MSICLNGHDLPQTNHFPNLGSIIHEDGGIKKDVKFVELEQDS